jgi:hypothetical protein
LDHLRRLRGSVPLEQAITQLIETKRTTGRSERYCKDPRMRLGRLQREFPDLTIARISTQELEDFLSRMKVGAETRNTHRREIRTLCFVSYRLASTHNAPQTALESGHDQAILFAHYRELVRPKDAERFFSIRVPCRPSSPRFVGAARTPGSSCGGTVVFAAKR